MGDCRDTKWPPRASEVFIQLAIINRKIVSFREADEYTKAMVRDGHVDAILHEKRSIELSEIAKDVPENRIIVVEGAPGVGKSTFAWEFCRRWERGEIAQQYQLVLLLRLRDERMSTAKSLNDLIYHPDIVLCHSMQKELNVNHGSNVLFILEGFDELPDTCRANSSIFMKLINGDILYKSTVLVTSRPWATKVIHKFNRNRLFQHIEILGFTEPQIKEYVTSALSNPNNDLDENAKDDFDDIVKYIDTFPQIKACMYIPLNTAIVVGVYEESKVGRCSLPKTLTQLYQALTQTILVRYLRGHREYSQQSCNVRDLKKDLPQEVYDNLLKICSLAYKGIFDREDNIKLVFSDLPPNFETLDLMQSVPQMYVTRGEVMSHNFLHLTVQEYFCAQHISFMSAEKQLEHFQKHKDGRFRVVLRFLAGLTKLTVLTHDQFKGLLREISDQQGDEQQRDCCKRMIPDISVSVHHINWLFEAQNTDLLHNHTVRFKFTGTMQPLEYYSLGYCIVHSNCKWSLGITEETEKEELQMLSSGAKSGDAKSTENRVALRTVSPMSSKCLNIIFTGLGPHLEELYLKLLDNGSYLSLSNLPVLHILELEMCSESTFNNTFSDFSLQSLESLTINVGNCGNSLGLKGCESIGKLLLTSTSLKELRLNEIQILKWCGYSMEAITKGLSKNMALPLRSLEIECKCTFSNTAATNLALFIRNSTALKYIRMCNVAFSGCGFIELTEALLHCSSLQEKKFEKLLLRSIASYDEVTKLNQMFRDHPDMLHCIDWKTNVSNEWMPCHDEKVRVIALAVQHNTFQENLDLSNSNISDVVATALAQALHHNSTLKELILSSNNISDVGATALAQALHHNSTLERLDLSYNNISDAGAIALAQALRHNSTPRRLELYGNDGIGEEGTRQLVQALTRKKSINKLWLPKRCEAYASQCRKYDAVKTRVKFFY